MKLLYNKMSLIHDTGVHPENRKRLEAFGDLQITEGVDGEQFLDLVHGKAYIDMVRNAHLTKTHLNTDTLISPGSYDAAVNAVGLTVMASETGDFALVRPPGHHAYQEHASGFCLFNNVAIAASKLASEGKRIFLFDFDGHLGDGTSHIFYQSDQVLYASIHQYPAFPGNGFADEIGKGPGKGFTINIPVPPGSADDIFLDATDRILSLALQFKPDVVAVSAGFDAHLFDPLLQLRVTNSTFYTIGKKLRGHFSQIFATLEGGYNTDVLPNGVNNFIAGINDAPILHDEHPTESSKDLWAEYKKRLLTLESNLRLYWQI